MPPDTDAAAVKAQFLDAPEYFVNPYEGITLTEAEKVKLAKMAFGEARGEPFEGQTAVVLVALNRCLHPSFPDSISEVLAEANQFSLGDTYTKTQMDAVEAALSGSSTLDLNTDVVFFSTGSLTCGSYYKTIGGHVFRTYS